MEMSHYAQDGRQIFTPMATFEADFDRRMLKLLQYADNQAGIDIGYMNLPMSDEADRLAELGVNIHELILRIRSQSFNVVDTDVFRSAEGNLLPAEPKPNLVEFLNEQADREADAHFRVQRSMFAPTDDQTQEPKEQQASLQSA